ncbi:MAG: hypothetical protein KKA76_18035 [Proteobacteria bacterium]|nr:hypothetical protein [Pseudomonadota bacterium]
MTVQLGSIVLDDNLQLFGIEQAMDIAVDQVVNLDGSSVLQTMVMGGSGRALAMVATQDGNTVGGVFLRSQIMAIKSLASGGQPVTLIHHLGTFSVLIISTEDISPVINYADPRDDDWYVGSIQMIEV